MFVDKFEKQSKEKWLETTTQFLKGKPYQELEWEFSEGLFIEPYYTQQEEKNKDFSYLQILQNHQLALNDAVSLPRFWYNQPFISVANLDKSELERANKEARQILMTGAEGVCWDLGKVEIQNINEKELETLLFEINLPYCAVSFQVDTKNVTQLEEFTQKYIEFIQKKEAQNAHITGGILYTNSFSTLDNFLNNFLNNFSTSFLETSLQSKTTFRFISLQVENQDDEAQSIATILFQVKNLVEKLNSKTDSNSGTTSILQNLQFVVEPTDSFFVTISKIRALRWLLIQLYDLYEVNSEPYIHCITAKGKDEKSVSDENWNLIRNTTQAFACILGGTNALSVRSHQNKDAEKSINWSNRIARNVSIMLREESFVDATADPISGAYYCEQMTDKLISSAWEKFQKMIP